LIKGIGAKPPLTALPPFHMFTTDTQMLEDTPVQYKVGHFAGHHALVGAGVGCVIGPRG